MKKTTQKTAIWGVSGSGKSYRAGQLIQPLISDPQHRVVIIDGYADGPSVATAKEAAAQIYAGEKTVILKSFDRYEALALIYVTVAASTVGSPIFLVMDEAADYLDKVRDPLKRVFNQCRHRGVGLIVASQRPASVHPNYRSQCDESYWLRLSDETDVSVAKSVLGARASTIRSLPTGEYIFHSSSGEPEPEFRSTRGSAPQKEDQPNAAL